MRFKQKTIFSNLRFTFNALNTVGNAIYKEDKEKAYDLFLRFTRMIRSSLMVSQKVFRSLEEEIQFTRDYLEFQKTRFKERFDFIIQVEKGIDLSDIQIPKMLIQGLAENSVKHAFYGVDFKGLIKISILKDHNHIKISIDDNGIGINQSIQLGTTSGTQMGEQILHDQIKQINKLYNREIIVKTVDKSEVEEEESGTKTEILLS